jgi:hypothetical protein
LSARPQRRPCPEPDGCSNSCSNPSVARGLPPADLAVHRHCGWFTGGFHAEEAVLPCLRRLVVRSAFVGRKVRPEEARQAKVQQGRSVPSLLLPHGRRRRAAAPDDNHRGQVPRSVPRLRCPWAVRLSGGRDDPRRRPAKDRNEAHAQGQPHTQSSDDIIDRVCPRVIAPHGTERIASGPTPARTAPENAAVPSGPAASASPGLGSGQTPP